MTFLPHRLHLSGSTDHRMVIHVIAVTVIVDKKSCYNIYALLDLLDYGICISDSKSPNFLLSIFLAFIVDVQKCFAAFKHSRNLLKGSILAIDGTQRPNKFPFWHAVQRHFTLFLSNRNVIVKHLILRIIVKGDRVVSFNVLIKIDNAVHAFFIGKWNVV
ncbi:hypothetical protein IMSAGC002_04718 [Lachnospiraceae bacterium]|nr:hypothetical protein IMSAGC002_04718 [Lachnospiraceae bacterium]